MARAIVRTTLAGARTVLRRINRRMGWPRCHCRKCEGTGVQPDCPCVSATDIDRNCPHITLRWARIKRVNSSRFLIVVKDRMAHTLLADGSDTAIADQDVGSEYDDGIEEADE